MKLNPLDRERLVTHPHDFAVVGPRRDFQAIRQGRSLDDKRVITRGLKRIRQAAKHAVRIVLDRGCLAVHDLRRMHDFAAESLSYRLVPETDAQDGYMARELPD